MSRKSARRVSLLVASVIVVTVASSAAVLATHNPQVADIVAVATNSTWNMACVSGSTQVQCDANDFDLTWHERAIIKPANGNLVSLRTDVTVLYAPLNLYYPDFENWMNALHAPACAPNRTAAGQLSTFVATVGSMTKAGTVSPITITGECNLTGGLNTAVVGTAIEYDYWVNSAVVAPTPTPTPTPTPKPTPTPTATPTPTPTPTATPTPRPTPTPTPTPSPSPEPTPTPTPTPSPSPSVVPPTAAPTAAPPLPTATADPAGTPAGGVPAGGAPAPSPSPQSGVLGWVDSVPAAAAVRSDLGTAWLSLAAMIAILLAMGWVGELFNDTLEANYDRILAAWRASRLRHLVRSVLGRGAGL